MQWERLGSSVEVDKKFLCKNMEMISPNLYCGYINTISNPDSENPVPHQIIKSIYSLEKKKNKINRNKISKRNSENYCIDVSDCFSDLPYLCEVNCTNQETKCNKWAKGLSF